MRCVSSDDHDARTSESCAPAWKDRCRPLPVVRGREGVGCNEWEAAVPIREQSGSHAGNTEFANSACFW